MIELRVSALLLATGSSSPTGDSRDELRQYRTVIKRYSDVLFRAGIRDTVVVIDQAAVQCMKDLRALPARFAVGPGIRNEMTESLRVGLHTLGDTPTGVLVCVADHAPPSAATIRRLALDHYSFCQKIIIPVCDGQQRYPRLFPFHILNEIMDGLAVHDVVAREARRVRQISILEEEFLFERDARRIPAEMDKRITA